MNFQLNSKYWMKFGGMVTRVVGWGWRLLLGSVSNEANYFFQTMTTPLFSNFNRYRWFFGTSKLVDWLNEEKNSGLDAGCRCKKINPPLSPLLVVPVLIILFAITKWFIMAARRWYPNSTLVFPHFLTKSVDNWTIEQWKQHLLPNLSIGNNKNNFKVSKTFSLLFLNIDLYCKTIACTCEQSLATITGKSKGDEHPKT